MFRFLNFHRHPEKKGEWVFYFSEPEVAAYFEERVKESGLSYTKLKDVKKTDVIYFSFASEDFDHAQILNSEAMGKFPRRFIPEKNARLVLMIVFLLMLGFALTGYIVTALKN